MSRFPYQFFGDFVVRTPQFSWVQAKEIFLQTTITEETCRNIYLNPNFKEALYLASPHLYQEYEKWIDGKNPFTTKLKHTLLKYYIRMSSRCTPFGLFAGVSLGTFTNKEEKSEVTQWYAERDTKMDMHFLVALSQHLISLPHIRKKLYFYPNTSLLIVGKNIRYTEYENHNGKRDYIISSAPLTQELKKIIELSKNGKTINQLTDGLVNQEISQEEAQEYIDELINNQVLVSNLEPNVSGNDFLDNIVHTLHNIGAYEEYEILSSIRKKINKIDECFQNPINSYIEVEKLVQNVDIPYEQKFLFQTDIYFRNQYEVSTTWKKDLKKAINFLNKITFPYYKNTHLEQFKKAFIERYEYEEIPLLTALDMEIGIGYRQDITASGVHPYLEDIVLPVSKEKYETNFRLSPVQLILNQKIQETILESQYTIQLNERDFEDFEEVWTDTPDTLALMCELISENQQEKMYLNGGSGCAAKLIARFCSEKSDIKKLAKEICDKETELNPNAILTEIIHLPESRIGNILRRPSLREYEIPYLAQSILPENQQIPAEDLYISIKNNKLILKSKRYDKEIIPYLTNAHNYSAKGLPVYHFLCDLANQNLRSGLYFSWGPLEKLYHFLPRIEYQNFIFSKAQWKITQKENNEFCSLLNQPLLLLEKVKLWRSKRNIPQWVQWVQSDNTLLVNLENEDMLHLFFTTISKMNHVTIEESLFHEQDNYTHQMIFSLYRNA